MKYEDHMVRAEHPRELAIIATLTDNALHTLGNIPHKLSHNLILIWCAEAWCSRNEPASLNELTTRAAEIGMRRTLTSLIHEWSQKDSQCRSVALAHGDKVSPGLLALNRPDPERLMREVRQREALGLLPEHGVERTLLDERLDPRWLLLLRQVIALAMTEGVTTTRQLAAILFLTYCSMAGARWVPAQSIAKYLDVEAKRITDALEPWIGEHVEQRRSPADERRVEFRLRLRRSYAERIIEDYRWYSVTVFDIPKGFQPHKTFGLPSLNRANLQSVPI